MITKTIQKTEEYFLQFTEDELKQLNVKPGDQLSWDINEDGSVILKPYVTMEIDVTDWSKDLLLYLIEQSLEKNEPVNQIIVDILDQALDHISNDTNKDTISKT